MRELRRHGRARASRAGDAAKNVMVLVATLTLFASVFLLLVAFEQAGEGGGNDRAADKGAVPDPWSTEGADKDTVPRRGGLDGSLEVPRITATMTPLVSVTSARAGAQKREPVRMGLESGLKEKAEEGAKAGYGEIGGPDRKVPLVSGAEAFSSAAALPLAPEKLKGWGHRFK